MEESTIALPVDDSPVNIKELEEALEVDGAREIAAGFLEDVAAVPDRLTDSLKLRDKQGVRSTAHMLKGCCLIIFARQTAELAADMERLSIDNNWESCDKNLPELLASLYKTVECLENYLDEI